MRVGLSWRPFLGEHRGGRVSLSFVDLKQKEYFGNQVFGALPMGVCMAILFGGGISILSGTFYLRSAGYT